jgi:hypothetical protein
MKPDVICCLPERIYPILDFYEKIRAFVTFIEKTIIKGLMFQTFRAALPKLKTEIQEQLKMAKQKYDEAHTQFKLLNPLALKDDYLRYIEEFRKTVRQYTAYTNEIDFYFPVHLCGKTYAETEHDFIHKWKRYQTLAWRAYLSVNELIQRQPILQTQLNLRLVGARHFSRLQQIFSFMVLAFKPRDPSRDEIETTESLLYGGLNDYENLEKSVRELLRTLIRETFLMGICWLKQMYTYLLDTFHTNVRKFLLSNEKFSHLREHTRFLDLVDLDYHTIVRELIRDAIRYIRDSRNTWSSYGHYDITERMRKLVLSIPAEIDHVKIAKTVIPGLFVKNSEGNSVQVANLSDIFKHIPPHQLLDQIYGSESFLTQTRDPQTANHHVNGRKTILELYTATCGRLLQDITSSFNSSVVAKMQSFDTLSNQRALFTRIERMSEKQIGGMANIRINDIRDSVQKAETMINDLSVTLALVDAAIHEMSNGNLLTENEREQIKERAHRQAAYVMHKKDKKPTTHDNDKSSLQVLAHSTIESPSALDAVNVLDDKQDLLSVDDSTTAAVLLLDLYQKHDQEDLTYGFLEGDSLEQDKSEPRAHDHIYVDPETMDYDHVVRMPPQGLYGVFATIQIISSFITYVQWSTDKDCQ